MSARIPNLIRLLWIGNWVYRFWKPARRAEVVAGQVWEYRPPRRPGTFPSPYRKAYKHQVVSVHGGFVQYRTEWGFIHVLPLDEFKQNSKLIHQP